MSILAEVLNRSQNTTILAGAGCAGAYAELMQFAGKLQAPIVHAMLMGDLLTLRQHKLPVKMVVFKNDSLAFVELEMKAGGILEFATDLQNPDFVKIAEGAGLMGLRAETPDQVEPMLARIRGTSLSPILWSLGMRWSLAVLR